MEINKTTVKIAGREYSLSGTESEEYIHRVAIYVDRKILELQRRYGSLSSNEIAVLAAINVADELLKLRDEMAQQEEGAKPPSPPVTAKSPPSGARNFFAKSK